MTQSSYRFINFMSRSSIRKYWRRIRTIGYTYEGSTANRSSAVRYESRVVCAIDTPSHSWMCTVTHWQATIQHSEPVYFITSVVRLKPHVGPTDKSDGLDKTLQTCGHNRTVITDSKPRVTSYFKKYFDDLPAAPLALCQNCILILSSSSWAA